MSESKEKKLIYEGERVDDIGFGGLKLIQKPEEFCFGKTRSIADKNYSTETI